MLQLYLEVETKRIEEEENEWLVKLANNVDDLFENGGGDAKCLVVSGESVRKQRGLVLLSGGERYASREITTEIYDYLTDSIIEGPEMNIPRQQHASVALPNGDVAVFGGWSEETNPPWLSSCEVLDVKNSVFRKVGDMLERRCSPIAVLLNTGLVLVIGGHAGCEDDDDEVLRSCEFYNPTKRKFYPSNAKTNFSVLWRTASLLPCGAVILCGGGDGDRIAFDFTEIYDPVSDSFVYSSATMIRKRQEHTAARLLDGRIMIIGDSDKAACSTEFYDPVKNKFTLGPYMHHGSSSSFSVCLPDGRVFFGIGEATVRRARFYDPMTNSFERGKLLLQERHYCSATLF